MLSIDVGIFQKCCVVVKDGHLEVNISYGKLKDFSNELHYFCHYFKLNIIHFFLLSMFLKLSHGLARVTIDQTAHSVVYHLYPVVPACNFLDLVVFILCYSVFLQLYMSNQKRGEEIVQFMCT